MPWSIEDLFYGARGENETPCKDNVVDLVHRYHAFWHPGRPEARQMFNWILDQLEIPPNVVPTWDVVRPQMERERYRLLTLLSYCHHYDLIRDSGQIKEMMHQIALMHAETTAFVRKSNAIAMRMSQGAQNTALLVPEEDRVDQDAQDTIVDNDPKKFRSWQQTFLYLREVLASQHLRRAGKYFFTRTINSVSNIQTNAFEQHQLISEFIDEHTCYDDNLPQWTTHTASQGNHQEMIKYLTERPIPEARDLDENCHHRSYAGDEYGRGAVIYDCAQDVAWPYARRDEWTVMAEEISAIRARIYGASEGGSAAQCRARCTARRTVTAPSAEDVAVVHFEASFPYDTLAELREIASHVGTCLQCAWYEAEAFECRDTRYEIAEPQIQAYMAREFPADAPDRPGAWGRSWQPVPLGHPRVEVVHGEVTCGDLAPVETIDDCVAAQLADAAAYPLSDEYLREHVVGTVTKDCFVAHEGRAYVPLYDPARRARHAISLDAWTALGGTSECVHRRSWVRVGRYAGTRWRRVDGPPVGAVDVTTVVGAALLRELVPEEANAGYLSLPPDATRSVATGALDALAYAVLEDGTTVVPVAESYRYFRVHTGRTWRDCDTSEFDTIYNSQGFTTHDRFLLFGFKGRTLFTVHEFDTYQITLIIIGWGGTGKSTIMVIMQKFWPPHLRGILSSNIEQKFGMSEVLKQGRTRAIFCNEVSDDLQLVQEDWQTSCSGEEGSYAVKHEAPWVGVCLAHHFWVGNKWPKHWKNGQGQVSRRLAGVFMETPIKERRGDIMGEIEKNIGAFERKMALAYFDMVDQYGAVDPMSHIDLLSPAFHRFYVEGRTVSDQIEAFLVDPDRGVEIWLGDFVTRPHSMETSAFRDLYFAWCARNNRKPKPDWTPDVYMPALRERGVSNAKESIVLEGGGIRNNVEILTGIRRCGYPNVVLERDLQ